MYVCNLTINYNYRAILKVHLGIWIYLYQTKQRRYELKENYAIYDLVYVILIISVIIIIILV